mgnify:CR=1 FL=1
MYTPLISAGLTYAYLKSRHPVPTKEQIIGLSDQWLMAVCSHNATAVADKYASNGILVGTVAERIKVGRKDIKTYFDRFLQKPALCGRFENHIVQLFDGLAINSGTYTFGWKEGEEEVFVPARFTFVYCYTPADGWKIANHHSSALPE